MFFWKPSSLWRVMQILACMLRKWEMSSFSLLSTLMISSWCVIINISFCKWRKNFLKSSKWKILVIYIFSLAWKWKGIVHIFFTSTKLGISRRFSIIFAWKITKLSNYRLIPWQSWKRMWTRMLRRWRFFINKSLDPSCMPCCVDALPTPRRTKMWVQIENNGRGKIWGTLPNSQHFEG